MLSGSSILVLVKQIEAVQKCANLTDTLLVKLYLIGGDKLRPCLVWVIIKFLVEFDKS